MCIASPARVLALDGTDAVVDVGGLRRRAALLMTPEATVGDWVLVAAGNVVRRIDAVEVAALVSELRAAQAAVAWAADERPRKPAEPGGSR